MSIPVVLVKMVRLTADTYSTADKGSLGYIVETYDDGRLAVIDWVGSPGGPGGRSGPIDTAHLEEVGDLAVQLPEVRT